MDIINERIVIAIPRIAVIKIALTKKGRENTMKEYEISKSGKIADFVIKCKHVFFGGEIGLYEAITKKF